MANRTDAYIGTVSRENLDKVEELREEVYNMFSGVDVKLRGRLGYNNPARYRERYRRPRGHQMIPLADAATFDVYVYRRDWTTPQGTLDNARAWSKGVWELINK